MNLITENEQVSQLSALLGRLIAVTPSIVEGQIGFETTVDLIVDTDLTGDLAAGRYVRVLEHGGFDLIKVTSGTVHYATASGAQFRVRMDRSSPLYFGAAGDGVTDDTAALDAVEASDATVIDLRGRSYHYVGSWSTAKIILNGSVIDDSETHTYAILTDQARATVAEALAALTSETEPKLASLKNVSDMISAALSGTSQTVQGRIIVSSATSGSRVANAWTKRTLETVDANSIAGAQLANSQVILPAGRYRLTAQQQFFGDPIARARFRDITNSATIGFESIDYGAANAQVSVPVVTTEVVFAAETTIELQYLSSVARANEGLGSPAAASPARYAVLEAIKVG